MALAFDYEQRRVRETLSYLPTWQSLSVLSPSDPTYMKTPPPDKALLAFAELLALRLDVEQASITLVDGEDSFVLCEVVRKSRNQPLGSTEDGDEGLMFGSSTIRRADGLSQIVVPADPPSQQEIERTSPHIVPDLHADPELKGSNFVKSNPHFRFFCAVPMFTPKGYCIGSISVLDRQSRNKLPSADQAFLVNMALTVFEHLEADRARRYLRRSLKLFGALDEFMETHSERKHRRTAEKDGKQRVQTVVKSLGLSSVEAPSDVAQPGQPLDQHTEFHHPTLSSDTSQDGFTPTSPTSPQANRDEAKALQKALVSQEKASLFERASRVLHEGFNAQGIIFLDASSGQTGGHKHVVSNEYRDSESGPSTTTHEDPNSSSSCATDSPAKMCNVLGSYVSGGLANSPIGSVSERDLGKLLEAYPQGQVFHTENNDGIMPSFSGSSDAASGSAPEDHIISNAPGQKAIKKAKSVRYILKRLFASLPGARSVAVFPSWDYRRARWYAAGLVWSNNPKRLLLCHEDLKFLKAFGVCIMAEVAHQDAKIDDSRKAAFLSMISHELRTPLHGISGNADLMRGDKLSPLQRSALRTIDSSTETLLDVINHLLDHNMLEQHGRNRRRQRHKAGPNKSNGGDCKSAYISSAGSIAVDVAAITEDIVRGISEETRRQVSLRTAHKSHRGDRPSTSETSFELLQPAAVLLDIQYRENWSLKVHTGGYRRILMNLLSNSIKYTRKGRITVTLKLEQESPDSPQSWISLQVADTGCGISPEYLNDHLYSAFQQEDTNDVGSGLGLSIVNGIVKEMRGRMSLHSVQGQGTTVTVRLPAFCGQQSDAVDVYDSWKNIQMLRRLERPVGVCFVSPATLATLSDQPAADGIDEAPVEDIWENVVKTCSDWLGIEVVACSDSRVKDANVFIVDETCLGKTSVDALLRTISSLGRDGCSGSKRGLPVALAASSEVISVIQRDHRHAIDGQMYFIPKPYGPRQLADVLTHLTDPNNGASNRSNGRSNSGEHTPTFSDDPDHPSTSISRVTPLSPSGSNKVSNEQHREKARERSSERQASDTQASSRSPSSETEATVGTVLLVEDNSVNMRLLQTFAKRLKLSYDLAMNGQEAVDRFSAAPDKFDIIWMDINMPVMDGMVATRQIRAIEARERKRQPALILALTGLSSAQDKHEALTSGMNQYYTKPIKLNVLRTSLDGWLAEERSSPSPISRKEQRLQQRERLADDDAQIMSREDGGRPQTAVRVEQELLQKVLFVEKRDEAAKALEDYRAEVNGTDDERRSDANEVERVKLNGLETIVTKGGKDTSTCAAEGAKTNGTKDNKTVCVDGEHEHDEDR